MTYEQFVKDYPGFTQYPKEKVVEVFDHYEGICGKDLEKLPLLRLAFIQQQLDFQCSNIIDATRGILDLRDKLNTCIFNEAP
jgi:hypothetical protein